MKLRRLSLEELKLTTMPQAGIDDKTLAQAQSIIGQVRQRGDEAVREISHSFGEIEDEPLMIGKDELYRAVDSLDPDIRGTLERTAGRIWSFAEKQMNSLAALECEIDGGRAGHSIEPIQSVGCYVPGGRYPLVSTALMTAVTAAAAGCSQTMVATPKPDDVMLAAIEIAGVGQVLRVGGAQAIAAMAYGTESVDKVDLIVGPGNRWVTAAKKLVAGQVGIDMLAGPTELVVVADGNANPRKIAADLLAQAEHDIDARPMLVTTDEALVIRVERALEAQVDLLSTSQTARESIANNGLAIICNSRDEAVAACNLIAPEHLELMIENPHHLIPNIRHAGCLFFWQSQRGSLWRLRCWPKSHVAHQRNRAIFSRAERFQFCPCAQLD